MDISLFNKRKSKRLSLKKQRKVIQLFNNLFSAGFNLTEMVDFLQRGQLLEDSYTSRMQQTLLNGDGLPQIMVELRFSDAVVTQLALADIHGNTESSLIKIESYLSNMILVKRKLIEVATYPIILLTFLVLIMLGLKNYLLPQIENGNIATQIISNFPMIFLLSLLSVSLVILTIYGFSKRQSRINLASKVSQLPFVGKTIQLYLTAYYAREWGNLIGQGVELSQVVKVMQDQKSLLFQEIGRSMEEGLLSGQEFHKIISTYPFFLKELSLMIEYGEVKSKLGTELEIYAEETWEVFFNRLTRATQLIQPFVFIIVALVIVMIYAAMLMPMYHNIGGNL